MEQQQLDAIMDRLEKLEIAFKEQAQSRGPFRKEDVDDLLALFRMVRTWLKVFAWLLHWTGWVLKKTGLILAPIVTAAIAIYMIWKGVPPKP